MEKVTGFEELLVLDDELRYKFVNTGMSMWNRSLAERAPYVDYEVTPQVVKEVEDGIMMTGSMAEGMTTARFFKSRNLSPDIDGEIEADIMFHILVLPTKEIQDQFLEAIEGKLGFYRVRNIPNCTQYIPKYICHRFEDIFDESDKKYITGDIVKDRTEQIIRLKDDENKIVKTAAMLLDVDASDVTTRYKTEINGPAVTLSITFTVRDGQKLLKLLAEADGVSCIRLPCWPVAGEEFRARPRPSGFPPQPLVDSVVSRGVHIVPKMTASGCDPEEWRLSFSIAEKLLAETRTDGQRLTYMIFKSMYYAHIKRIKIDNATLPSYFAKTVMFWTCERINPKEWTKENLRNNLKNLFMALSEAFDLNNRHLEHYFIPGINLLDPYSDILLLSAKQKIDEIADTDPMLYLPERQMISNACSQTRQLILLFNKLSDWVNMCDSNTSITQIIEKLAQGLPGVFKGKKAADSVNVLQGISQVVRLFDKSKTTGKNLDKIDAALGAWAGTVAETLTPSTSKSTDPGTSPQGKDKYVEDDLD